jgi:YD repeat-containing protein
MAQTDANGHDTDWFRDARDRVTLLLHPTADDGSYAVERFGYDDTTRTITHRDARDIATISRFDPLQWLIEERLGPLTRSRDYDPNGNLIEQTDYAGQRRSSTTERTGSSRATTALAAASCARACSPTMRSAMCSANASVRIRKCA